MNHDERLRKLPPREVCEHGSIKVKCPICELVEVEAENARLRYILKDLRANGQLSHGGDGPLAYVDGESWRRFVAVWDALGEGETG